MNPYQSNYSMNKAKRKATREISDKANRIAMIIFSVVVLTVGIIWIEIDARKKSEAQWLDSWDITINRNIEWSWAGKEQK